MAPTIHYFNVKGRAQVPVLLAAFTGQELIWNRQPDWPADKPNSPFGQLPYLVDGDVKIGQSQAIARYLGRKYGLEGENDAEFAQSEQLLEEGSDLITVLAKAAFGGNKDEAFAEVFATTLPAHLTNLEKLLNGRERFTNSTTTGEIAIFSALNFYADIEKDVLAKYPNLQAFYNRIAANPGVAAYLAEGLTNPSLARK
jgi:glutathione S-transferase